MGPRDKPEDDNRGLCIRDKSPMKKLIDAYHQLLTWALVATVAILIIPVTLQIVSRFSHMLPGFMAVPHYIWTEELSRFLFIWMVMIGAMIGIRENAHFDVDVWPEYGAKGQAILKIVSHVGVLIFALVFVYWGIKFVQFGWAQTSELADLPMNWIFAAWPITGITWIIFTAEIFLKNYRILAGKEPA